jgi:D-alanyl-D-alanine dipeptidase
VKLGATVALVLALAALGCSEKKTTPASMAPPAALPLPHPPAPGITLIPPTTRQLVTAITDGWTSTHAVLQRWQRTDGGAWTAVGASWPAVVGKTGSAWGAGLHGLGAPPGQGGAVKKEGDGKSPAGAFGIRNAYGYADEPPKDTKLDYTSTGRGDLECVDDPASEHYASIVDRKQVAGDWESAEQMMRDDALYTWVIDVAHNPDRKPRAGSCIFLHVWGGPETSTVGCTAMEEARLVELIKTLDPAQKPVYVLLPRAEYQALAVAWGLPAQ